MPKLSALSLKTGMYSYADPESRMHESDGIAVKNLE